MQERASYWRWPSRPVRGPTPPALHQRKRAMQTAEPTMEIKIRTLVAQVDASKGAIAAERDKLRDTLSDLTDLLEATDRGLEALDSAVDYFSEYL